MEKELRKYYNLKRVPAKYKWKGQTLSVSGNVVYLPESFAEKFPKLFVLAELDTPEKEPTKLWKRGKKKKEDIIVSDINPDLASNEFEAESIAKSRDKYGK